MYMYVYMFLYCLCILVCSFSDDRKLNFNSASTLLTGDNAFQTVTSKILVRVTDIAIYMSSLNSQAQQYDS